jgi:SAM-dependent methyltransferase
VTADSDPRESQPQAWSRAAAEYEREFVDPYREPRGHPLLTALARIRGSEKMTALDLGCGIGPLLPELASRFARVEAVDFAPGMLDRARERCRTLGNVTFHERRLSDLAPFRGLADVAIAVNSLVMPDVAELDAVLAEVFACLRPSGHFLGIVPAMDGVLYHSLLLLERARAAGMPLAQARKSAAQHAEHHLYDFAFGGFAYRGIEQHFWQPFEVGLRLRRAGFVRVRREKARLSWDQHARGADFRGLPPPWDWFFQARRPR